MLKKAGTAILVCTMALLAVGITGCGGSNEKPRAADNEIMLVIKLDLKEDIGLLVIDHVLDGNEGSGGVSNADRSMIKRDDTLYWTFDKRNYDDPSDTVDLTLRFTVVTEYCDPNYDNIYPEEFMIPIEAVSFSADFGGTYCVTIAGDKTDGYHTVLNERE